MSDASKERAKHDSRIGPRRQVSPTCACVDTESGEVMEEARLRTSPEAFRRRFPPKGRCV